MSYLLRYQLPDFLLLRAGLPTLLVVLFGFMLWKQAGSAMGWDTANGHQFAQQVFRNLAGVFITLGAFLGVARLVTDDRSNGYFRLLFSKPVSIERFYVQQWLLSGAGFVLIAGLLGAWFQAGTVTVPVREAMVVMGLTWILVGGVGFLLSASTNADAAILVVLFVVSNVLHALKDTPRSPLWPWLRQVTRALPPTQKLDFIRDQLYAGSPMPWSHAAHVAGYGVLAFIAALVVLRRSSFAR
jgi:hypothetical protein